MDESAILEERRDNRPRSNTWPLPDPSEFTKSEREADQSFKQLNEGPKKSSRKNAWGNLSYADLITQAIQSSADKRLTLSQIYEWMVNTVPYFRDKGDSNSSAGWKNSIRHNLSLHSKFVRVQNEGNGKSSWWMLNPDAKGGKTSRRRSGSLDSAPKSERKRGRTKKEKIKEEDECPSSPHLSVNRTRDVNRANSPGNASPTNSSSSDSLLTIPESESPLPFPLGESFARPRTSSNASTVSSLGGRLSPIPSQADELEIAEDPVPTSFGMTSTPNPAAEELSQLADSMSLDSYAPESNRLKQTLTPVTSLLPSDPAPHNDLGIAAVSNSMGSNMSNTFDTGYDSSGYLQPAQHRPRQSLSPEMLRPSITATQPIYNGLQVLAQTQQQHTRFQGNYHSPQELSSHQNNNPPQMNNVYCRDQEMEVQQTPVNMFPSYQSSFVPSSTAFVNTLPQNQNCSFTDPYLQQICAPPGMMTNGVHSLQVHPFSRDIRMANNNQLELMNEKFPSDLELDAFHGGLDCDIDSIIHDELNMGDGGLDFNFEQLISQLPNNPLTVGELRGGLY